MEKRIPAVWYVYVIECCTPDHFYVGIARRTVMRRWLQHAAGLGSRFTALHGVHRPRISFSTYDKRQAEFVEHFMAKELRRLNPWACVRGANSVARCSHFPAPIKPPWFDALALDNLLQGLRRGSIQLGDEGSRRAHRP